MWVCICMKAMTFLICWQWLVTVDRKTVLPHFSVCLIVCFTPGLASKQDRKVAFDGQMWANWTSTQAAREGWPLPQRLFPCHCLLHAIWEIRSGLLWSDKEAQINVKTNTMWLLLKCFLWLFQIATGLMSVSSWLEEDSKLANSEASKPHATKATLQRL